MAHEIPVGILEEYTALREEIRAFHTKRDHTKNFVFMITLAVVGLDASNLVTFGAFLFPVSALLIWFLWFDELRYLKAIFRAATYIEVFIEPKVAGLNWETMVGKQPIQTSWMSRIVSHAEYPLLFVGFVWFSWIKIDPAYHRTACVGAAVAALMAIGLIIAAFRTAKYGRSKEKLRWKEIEVQIVSSAQK